MKKNVSSGCQPGDRPLLALIPRAAQLLLLLLLTGTLHAYATAVNEIKLTVSLKDAKIASLFRIIQQKSHYQFLYNDEDVHNAPSITVNLKDATVPEILEEAFRGTTMGYRINGNTVVIFPARPTAAPAQEASVSGTVRDTEGKTLAGVTIGIKNSAIGTQTNEAGHYTLKLPGNAAVLVFSFVGYVRQEEAVQGRSTINIVMQPSVSSLNNVVVIGYGTKKQVNVTGAVSTVKGTELKQSPSPNLSNALAGRVTGVFANNRSGEPGNDYSTILIRGKGTLNDNSPLIVIDGIANRGAFERLNPDDVESITVLKDASAAIYGAQAANGVILVTTKRGKPGKPVINYNGSYGLSQPTNITKLLNAGQYATYMNEKFARANKPLLYSDEDIRKYYDGSDPLGHPNTDWYKAVLKNLSPQTRHALSVNGGSDKTDYFISGEYLYQDGIYRKSATNYRQYNLRSNVGASITRDLRVAVDVSGRLEDRAYSNYGSGTIFGETLSAYPTLPDYYPNGLPGPGLAGGRNPVLMATGKTGYNKVKDYFLQSNLSFDLKLPDVTKGLSVSGLAAFDFQFHQEKRFQSNWDAFRYNPNTKQYDNVRSTEGPMRLDQGFRNYRNKTYQLKVAYERKFGVHDISGFVAYEQSEGYDEGITAMRKDFLSDQVDQISLGADKDKDNSGNAAQVARQNLFGRVSYGYDNRYLAELILRHDGSFNFPKNKRWGTFPGITVGWRISEEPFFRDAVPAANQLKLKASWGKMGNDKINPYQYILQYNRDNGVYFGNDPQRVPGLSAGVSPNANITWEVAETKNIGIESAWWNGLLTLNAEYFTSRRSNILVARNASVPATTGLNGSLPPENIGIVDNHGFEIEATHRYQVNRHLNYNLGVNYTFAKNKVVFNDEAANIPEWQRVQGHPMGSWLVYKTAGIYHNQQEIDNSIHPAGTQPGDIRYIDVNGDKKITSDDQVRIYESTTPTSIFGITMGVNYKGWGLNVLWQGQLGAKMVILPSQHGGSITPPLWMYEDRWTPSNPNASMPAAFDRDSYVNNRQSDFWIRNAAFLRLKTVELSYTFTPAFLQQLKLQHLKVYANGFNLLVFSPVKKYDPELNNVTGNYYPQTRIFNAGVSISL
ncbi:TonB-dependent receptor [Chitinophaga solisilvae]|uniref:TonB-dependent receptor n=1 Tax=Chitinophaga solisilvae TaxID=1233460 RepID=UPI00136AF826|nr:TonB-dependent receptor [Chitinophaga solisilvae]